MRQEGCDSPWKCRRNSTPCVQRPCPCRSLNETDGIRIQPHSCRSNPINASRRGDPSDESAVSRAALGPDRWPSNRGIGRAQRRLLESLVRPARALIAAQVAIRFVPVGVGSLSQARCLTYRERLHGYILVPRNKSVDFGDGHGVSAAEFPASVAQDNSSLCATFHWVFPRANGLGAHCGLVGDRGLPVPFQLFFRNANRSISLLDPLPISGTAAAIGCNCSCRRWIHKTA